jgi:hypothetical protein
MAHSHVNVGRTFRSACGEAKAPPYIIKVRGIARVADESDAGLFM